MQNNQEAFLHASPRTNPGPVPFASVAIHGAVLAAWIILFAGAFVLHGVAAWATGVAYVAYDTILLLFTAVCTVRLLARRRPEPVPGRATLGVIVAAHNEAPVLEVTLDALWAQTVRPDVVVLADDGSDDSTPEVLARRYGLDPSAESSSVAVGATGAADTTGASGTTGTTGTTRLVWMRLPRGGKAHALNAALASIGTDVVVTVDADTLLDPFALAEVQAAFSADHELVAATGVLTPVCGGTVAGRVLQWFQTYEYVRNFLSRYAWMRADSLLLISGAFAAFRREALTRVGGFDEDCLVEDYELIHRLMRFGRSQGLLWRTAVLGRATARTDAPGTVAGFLRQRRRWFGGFLQTQWWYREMVGDPRYGALGLALLPVKAVDTVQPLFGLSALFLLFLFLFTGRWSALIPAGGIILGKIALDLCFHAYSVVAYRRWIGSAPGLSVPVALGAALIEPFSFQILRHVGATLGWVTFLGGPSHWGRQERTALMTLRR